MSARDLRVRHTLLGPARPLVLSGPFSGMRYGVPPVGSSFWPKLLGTYESCLQPLIEELISERPARVVDVGCAEGYYAVGLALRLQDAQVVASDVSPRARRLCARLAFANGVAERVEVTGGLTTAELERLVGPSCFLLVDAEGAELELLSLEQAPALARTTILVELHDFVDPSISTEIPRRFASTHEVRVLSQGEPNTTDVGARLTRLAPDDRRYVLSEFRPETMQWAVLRPTCA